MLFVPTIGAPNPNPLPYNPSPPPPEPGWSYANYTYDDPAHAHAVTGLSSGESYGYDANGNMTSRVEGGLTYAQTFDAENRLVSVTVGGQTTQFVYDGDGTLVKRVRPDGTATLYIGAIFEIELNAGGAQNGATSYYALPGARVQRSGASLYYILTDHLGSASVALDANGAAVGEQRYYPFGATRAATGTWPTDRLFTGHRELADLGLYHFNARFYSAALGRFVSADTIVPDWANPQSLNRYSYVLNNPLRYTDPSGHMALCGIQCEEAGGAYGVSRQGTPLTYRRSTAGGRSGPTLQPWEIQLGAQTVYAETNNGQYPLSEASRIAHVFVNRATDSRWGSMWNGVKPYQTALYDLWNGDDNSIPPPTSIEAARETTARWSEILNQPGRKQKFVEGWRRSQKAMNQALDEARAGVDPTNGSVYFVALGRTRGENESAANFEARFTAEYALRVSQFEAYASRHPDFRWSVTPPEGIVRLDEGRQLVAVFTGNHGCVWELGACR